jgi:hypothetical protein
MSNKKVFVGGESGFVSYKSCGLSLAMNILGHQQVYWNDDTIDPRLIGSIPIWMCYNNKSLLPATPYSHGYFVSIPKKFPFGGRIKRLIDSIYRWKANRPYISGFLSYIKKRKSILICQGFSQNNISNLDDFLIIEGFCPLWEIQSFSAKVLSRFFKKFISYTHNSTTRNSLIEKSDINISKTIVISNELLYIRECYHGNNLCGLNIISFTFRTFEDVHIRYIEDFVCFISEINGTYIAVSMNKEETLTQKHKLSSSTGKVIIWEIRKRCNKIQEKTILSRIIIGNDDINEISKIKNSSQYLEKVKRIKFKNNV